MMGEHSRGEERLSMMRARFLGQVEGEKGSREASRHWISITRRGARTRK